MSTLKKANVVRDSQVENTDVPPPYTETDATRATRRISYSDNKSSLSSNVQSLPRIQSISSDQLERPIAIPQVTADPDAPFLPAYATSLLSYGITAESWKSLLDTLSTILRSSGTDLALSQAGGVAKRVGDVPAEYGRSVTSHARSLSRNITDCAKQGNILGVAAGTLGGGICLTFHATFGAVGALLGVPAALVGATARGPLNNRQLAVAAIKEANKNLFNARGLKLQLLNTSELTNLLKLSDGKIVQTTASCKSSDAEVQMRALKPDLSELVIDKDANLSVGVNTLWLVVCKNNVN